MIDTATRQLLYRLHSWLGLGLASILLVMILSGAFSLFYDELRPWEETAYRGIGEMDNLAVDDTIESILNRHAVDFRRDIRIELPDIYHRALRLKIPLLEQSDRMTLDIDPVTRESIEVHRYRLADFFRNLHTTLLLPDPIGSYIVGVIGHALMLAIATGLFLHRKFFQAFFTFRFRHSRRMLVSDSHKLLGLWALLFNIMIAFTGAAIGLSHPITHLSEQAIQYAESSRTTEHPGDAANSAEKAGKAEMVDIDKMLGTARDALPDSIPYSLVLRNWGLSNASITVRSHLPYHLSRSASFEINGVTGEIESSHVHGRDAGIFTLIFEAMVTLHFADYLGLWLKFTYLGFALLTALMVISGLALWIESRSRRSRPATMPLTGRVLLGIQVGFVFGVAVLIPGHKISTIMFAPEHMFKVYFLLLFASWGLGVLSFYRLENTRLLLSAWLLLIAMILLTTSAISVYRVAPALDPMTLMNHSVAVTPDLIFGGLSFFLLGLLAFIRRYFRKP